MYMFRYGGKKGKQLSLVVSNDMVAVRSKDRSPVYRKTAFAATPISQKARSTVQQFLLEARFSEAGVDILRTTKHGDKALRDRARSVLKSEKHIEFAGRVLCDPKSKRPVLYTENFFVKFEDDKKPSACAKLLKSYELAIKRPLEYARNAYFVSAKENTGLKIFGMAQKILNEPSVEFCHPELIRRIRRRGAFPQQWHLFKTTVGGQIIDQHANVDAAWALSKGEGTVIAVIDNGVDMDHEEFRSSGKIMAPRDVTRQTDNPRPEPGEDHGTACAGVACADGLIGASGVAPRAKLMPIRLASGLGSQQEADAFIWAATNGADVISCSWGPEDGDFTNPNDPIHDQVVQLPDSTRIAIDWAIKNGRNGKGCVIVWAAGNGNESVDNDGYARYEKVIAVAACNDSGKKSPYSDFGKAVWCSFPSNNYFPSRTLGIWTTDRSAVAGYNPGNITLGDAAGNYTNSFGGTSSAAPGAAGVAALILARNPNLRYDEVKDLIRRSCDKIDSAGGNYDQNGRSNIYGYGRINAKKACDLAVVPQPNTAVVFSAVQDVPIQDLKKSQLALQVANIAQMSSIVITVDIEHTYIGDLIVSVKPPVSSGVGPVVLHNRVGGGTDNIKTSYDTISTPALAALLGKSPAGTWTLIVEDKDNLDTGKIRSFTLKLEF